MSLKTFLLIALTIKLSFTFSQNQRVVLKDTVVEQELNEVIITATRTERQLSSLPLPAQIISSKEIKSINALRLNDLLNEQTGLITIPDFGGGEGIQMQGLDSQYTLILIDGVPLIGRSAGTLDLNRVALANIKQIEVVKGASSSLYGSEALGGVINIITDKPKSGFHGTLNHRSGSFNTLDTGVNLGYKKNNFGIQAFVNRFSSDGYDLNNDNTLNTVEPYENYTLNAKINYDFSESTKLFTSVRYFTQEQDNVATDELRGESSINEWNAHARLSHEFNEKWDGTIEFYATQYQAEEFLLDLQGAPFSSSIFDQTLLRPEIRSTFAVNDKSTLSGGLGLNHERLERTDFSENPEFNSPYIFIQYDTNPTEKLNVIVGARFDAHNEYKSQFSPKAAVRYEITEKLAAKGSVGYGFKAPDFRQLYFNFSNATVGYTVLGYNAVPTVLPELEEQGQIANIIVPISEFEDELKPENSVAFNLGFDYDITNSISAGINVFRNNINDLIDTRVIANKTNGQNVFSYYNVNRVYTQGLEFNAQWKLDKALKISGGYQLLYAKDKDAEEAFKNGEVFARENPSSPSFQLGEDDYFGLFNRSRHMANFKIFYTLEKWNASANIRGTYRSKYGLLDTNGNTYLDEYDTFVDGYSVWDVAINKTFYNNYTLSLGVDNALDFTDTQNISNIPGRIVYGKLNINF